MDVDLHRSVCIHEDYQVGRPVDPFDAVGCGHDVAKGALYAATHLAPRERVLAALQAAERFSAGVRAPFIVESLSI